MTEKILAIEPKVYRFAAGVDGAGYDELMEVLQSQRDTKPVPIRTMSDVLLNDRGLIQQSYRLTTTALQQLCSVLIPGLSQVVANVSGLKARTGQHAAEARSYPKAIELLNWSIKFRAKLLENCSLIIDRQNRQVEGVVGQRYKFLSNLEMLNRVEQYLGQKMPNMLFHEAALAGRRLLLRYREQEWAYALETPTAKREPFYVGVHFSNSELGDCCVRGTGVLSRAWSKTAAIYPFDEATSVVHFQGEKFGTKFRSMLDTVGKRLAEVRQTQPMLERLQAQPLGLQAMTEACQTRMGEIVQKLTKQGVPKSTAYDSLVRAMLHGSYKADSVPTAAGNSIEFMNPAVLTQFVNRTAFDLFNGLAYVASQREPARQEAIEQHAFKMVTGEILI
jgi:hypothetical protein